MASRPFFLIRTWFGGYVELSRVHLVLIGWIRFLFSKL